MSESQQQCCTLSVVVPVYCEGMQLAKAMEGIILTLDSLNTGYEVILVDDGSLDDTWQVVMAQCKQHSSVKGIRLSRNFGKEAALAAGLEHANGSAIVVMDGDLQHPPELIPRMLALWEDGAEVVEAVKQHRGREKGYSKARAQIFNGIFTLLTGYDLHGASDFKLMDRRVLEAWRGMGERSLFFRGMNAWLGFKREQIPFDVPVRIGGQSSWSTFQLIKLAMTAVTSFSTIPLHLVTLTGIAFAVFAFILGAQTLYLKISGEAIDGFTTVIILILVTGGVVMLGLGIIGTYIERIYEEVKGRPRYVIAEQVE